MKFQLFPPTPSLTGGRGTTGDGNLLSEGIVDTLWGVGLAGHLDRHLIQYIVRRALGFGLIEGNVSASQ